jgi:GntR family transcriptional regulator/MocR family aminotransferase
MKYKIDPAARESAYLQLYRQLRADLVSGEPAYGTRLPSKRLLAGELGVSLVTVEHAYALLCDEGYVEARERSGYYACFGGKPRREGPLPALPVESAPEAPPEDFPFSVLARTMRRVLADYDRRILLRSPGPGTPELRAAIAAYIARTRGLEVPPERIVVGAGAEYLYSQIAQLFGRGTLFALEEPCYRRIRQVYEANGLSCLSLPMGKDGIVSDALSACEAGVLHVTPFESYPSRVTASAGKRHEYAAWARKHDSFLVEDDYASEFASATKQIDTICSLAPERVLYLNSFSRSFAPSMRTAFLVLPEGLTDAYREKLGFYSCTVPVFEQYVLAEFIASGELERYVNRRRRKLRQQKG